MKRAFAAMLAACMVIGITGCGVKREPAESVVKNAIEAVRGYDSGKVHEYWGGDALDAESGLEAAPDAIGEIFKGISYEIIGSQEGEDRATVDVRVSNVDMSHIMSSVIAEMLPKLFADAFMPESEKLTEEDTDQMFADALVEALRKADNPRVTNTVTVSLSLVDDKWVIDDDNDAAIDAMLGGISSFADAMDGAFSSGDSGGDPAEQTPKENLSEIRNWLVGDIWNDGFCDLSWYYSTGKSSTGGTMDAGFAIQQLDKAMEKKENYDAYIGSLPDDFDDISSVWPKLSEQIDVLYSEVKSRGAEVTGTGLDTDLYNQYFDAFDGACKQIG